MYLLRTEFSNYDGVPLRVDRFSGGEIPRYAILSHTWGEDEVLFRDVVQGMSFHRKAYDKVKRAAAIAYNEGYEYIWIDTCCIDKDSSAELSEAINSMYEWYSKAEVCYAYLPDVPTGVDFKAITSVFGKSRWFTRGWTLQELLAPERLHFYSSDWVPLGTKSHLAVLLESLTGIHEDVLLKRVPLNRVSIASRMSWAASRETTRVEDIAYCLMGIFSVNMPMLYGEGRKAFHRLQEEIMKGSDDESLFAWFDPHLKDEDTHGLLADSPSVFGNHIIMTYAYRGDRAPFSMSNKGLRIDLPLTNSASDPDIFTAALNCSGTQDTQSGFAALKLWKLSEGSHRYARVMCNSLMTIDYIGGISIVFVPQDPGIRNIKVNARHAFYVCIQQPIYPEHVRKKVDIIIRDRHGRIVKNEQDGKSVLEITRQPRRLAGSIHVRFPDAAYAVEIMLGSSTLDNVGFAIWECEYETPIPMRVLEKIFQPQPLGSTFPIRNHNIRIDARSVVYPDEERYFVDIHIIPTTNDLSNREPTTQMTKH